MNELAHRAARITLAAGCVAAAAGLIEGVLLAVVHDPFGASWALRGLSLLTFLSAYFVAGCLLGAMAGLPLCLAPGVRADRVAPAAVCALMGAAYANAWIQAVGDASRMERLAASTAGALLFAGCGMMAHRWLRRERTALTLGMFAGAAVCAFTLAAPWAPGMASEPPSVPAPAASDGIGARPADGPGPTPPRNLIIVVADTLRADHLSLYGYERPTSPELTRYALSGTTFTNAIAAKTKTSPSVASMFTGTYPHTHGIVTCRTPLPDTSVTLAEVLRGREFATHAIVANSNVGRYFHFDQGFDSVDEIWSDPAAADARGVTDHALAWLGARHDAGPPGRPFFLYVHYIDPHLPYGAPAPWTDSFDNDALSGKLAHIKVPVGEKSVGAIRPSARLETRTTDIDYYVARYDGEIAYLDHHLGRLFEGLSQLGLASDTLVVFTSDHGEALGEHEVYFAHGGFAYEDTARIPLVMVSPGRVPAGGLVARTVETVSLAPTVLQALKIPAPASMEVPAFWDLAAGAAADPGFEGTAFIEADTSVALRHAIRDGRWKLIENSEGFDRGSGRFGLATVMNMNEKERILELMTLKREFLGRHELYDIASDPGETVNLAAGRPEIVQALLPRLKAWRARGAANQRLQPVRNDDMPEDVLRNLKSLGYVN